MTTNDTHLRPPRPLLVLGHKLPFRTFDSYAWEERPRELNVTDYNAVIADFTPLVAAHQRGEQPKPLNLDAGQFRRFVAREGTRLFVIGPPSIASNRLGLPLIGCGNDYAIHEETGEAVKNVAPSFESYFRRFVPRWSGWVLAAVSDLSAMEELVQEMVGAPLQALQTPPRVRFTGLARTSSDKALAFEWNVSAFYRRTVDSGSLFWLPMSTDFGDSSEAIVWLIENQSGVPLERPLPDWHARFRLPGESDGQHEIAAKRTAIIQAQEALRDEQARLEELLRFKRLLYEQDDTLERIVWDTLRKLGGVVTEPTARGRDDGEVRDPFGRVGILEAKGRNGTLKLSDVRELEQWRSVAQETAEAAADIARQKGETVEPKGAKRKGILVVNLRREMPPTERGDTVPPNCIEALTQYRLSLLPTTQLFRALADQRAGRLDQRAFWDAVFETVGVTSLPEPDDEGASS